MAEKPLTEWKSGLLDCFEEASTFSGIPLFVPPAALSLRASIRNKNRIKGSLCKDIAASCFCMWCSWCQMHRELKHRNQTPTVINVQTPTVVQMQPAPMMMVAANPPPAVRYVSQPNVVMASY
ncbi:cornifelin-like [Scomber scombrus]|uniref:Cornifelin-like n=1 Tax=Scomber scombrus TaxID=13677 RepID=A0AAV1PI33_SCOSC